MIMCVLLCYPVSIRIYYQQGVLFLVHGPDMKREASYAIKLSQYAHHDGRSFPL